MNPLFFDHLGIFFALLFSLTLFWEIISRLSQKKNPSSQTLIISPKGQEQDPFKNLAEPAKESSNVQEQGIRPMDPAVQTAAPAADNSPGESVFKLINQPSFGLPNDISVDAGSVSNTPAAQQQNQTQNTADPQNTQTGPAEIGDPWKSLMQQQSKEPAKSKEIPLELDLKPEDKT